MIYEVKSVKTTREVCRELLKQRNLCCAINGTNEKKKTKTFFFFRHETFWFEFCCLG
jgi:hypothetical protein